MNNKELKIAIIGCGNDGSGHARVLDGIDGVRVTAIAETNIQRQKEMKPEFPNAVMYQDYKELFHKETLDAVCIATPHDVHYEQAIAALQNDCHLLLEKPMALKKEHCQEIVDLAKQKNLILQVGFECRNSQLYVRVKEIIDSGEIGELLSMSYIHYRASWLRDWYCKRQTGGDSIAIIETCHYLDLMRYWSGKDVEWAFATTPKTNFRTEYEYPDTSFAHIGFQGGIVGNFVDSHARSTDCFLNTELDKTESYGSGEGEYMDPVYGHQFEYSIVGTKGSLWVRMLSKQISVLTMQQSVGGERGNRPQIALKRVEDYNKQSIHDLVHDGSSLDKQFIRNVQNGEQPALSPDEALKSHLGVLAIEESERTGEKVFVTS